MLIHESQLVQTQSPTILDMLDEAVFLTEDESKVTAAQVPVIVKESAGFYMVDFNDIQSVSESCNMNYFESIQSISEANDIDTSKIVVAVDEGDAILLGESFDPKSMVVRPIQEANDEYQICLEAIEYCLETGDLDSLDSILLFEDARPRKRGTAKAARLMGYSKADADITGQEAPEPKEAKKLLGPDPGHDHSEIEAAKKLKEIKDAKNKALKTGQLTKINVNGRDLKFGTHQLEQRNRLNKIDEKKREEAEAKKDQPKTSHSLPKSQNWAAKKEGENQSDWAAWADKKHEENNKPVKTDDVAEKAGSSNLPAVAQNSAPIVSGKPSSDGPHVPAVAAASSPDISDAKVSGSSNLLKYGAAAAGGAALAGGAWYAYKKYKNQPKSVIGKRIAALRQIYAKFMKKAQSSHDSGVAANLKRVAAKVLSVIDKLMGYLQNKAG